MTDKEREMLAMLTTLNSMLYQVLNDYNKSLVENAELRKEIDWFKRYIDELVEHKDMVCLPADLKNLRNTNAKLTTENESLNKRIDSLIKKFDELTNHRDEIDGDKKNMYLNPEKHIGGSNPKKHIEFDASTLVNIVKDYAASLKKRK